MKIRIAILSAAMAALALTACGDDTGGTDAGTAYAISAGTFNVSNAQVGTSGDTCNLIGSYTAQGKQIALSDANGVFSFDLSNGAVTDQQTISTAVLDGNTFDQPVPADFTASFQDGCVLHINRQVVGNLVADNTASLTLTATIEPDATSAADCSADSPSGTNTQCTSEITFTATKAQ